MTAKAYPIEAWSMAGKLIWLVGLPRSGTSWLGKIFDSHPETLYRSEPDNYPQLNAVPLFPESTDKARYRESIHCFARSLPRMNAYRYAAKQPLFPKAYRSYVHNQAYRATTFAAKVASRANIDIPVIGARADRIQPPPVLLWKSINSLGRLSLVLNSLPQARGVHIIRHPCGHIGSLLRGESQLAFGDTGNRSEYYGVFEELLQTPQAKRRGLTVDALRGLSAEERLAWYWLLVNEKALDEAQELKSIMLVRYEDLCENPLARSQELFEFTGLTWSRQTERFIQRSTSKNNQKYFSVFKDPMVAARRWREELSQACIDRIMAVVAQCDKLAELYPPL